MLIKEMFDFKTSWLLPSCSSIWNGWEFFVRDNAQFVIFLLWIIESHFIKHIWRHKTSISKVPHFSHFIIQLVNQFSFYIWQINKHIWLISDCRTPSFVYLNVIWFTFPVVKFCSCTIHIQLKRWLLK